MTILKRSAVTAVALFAALQVIRPSISHPAVTAEIQAPEQVKQILRNSCYNCHSNETRLAWFDQAAPAYWLVAHDVREARSRLNFSELGKLPPAAQRGMLFEAVNQIRLGAMPLASYRRVHPEAEVSGKQIRVLEEYLAPFSAEAGTSPPQVKVTDVKKEPDGAAVQSWVGVVAASPNGISF